MPLIAKAAISAQNTPIEFPHESSFTSSKPALLATKGPNSLSAPPVGLNRGIAFFGNLAISMKAQLKSVFERGSVIISGLMAWLRENCSPFWFLTQLVCLTVIYLVYRKWPTMPVGFAIGAAGVIAAGMTLRDGRWKAVEKFL